MNTLQWLAPLLLACAALGAAGTLNGWRRMPLILRGSYMWFLLAGMLLLGYLSSKADPATLFVVGFAVATMSIGLAKMVPLLTVKRMIVRIGHPLLQANALAYLHRWAEAYAPTKDEQEQVAVYTNIICTSAGALLGRERPEDADRLLSHLPERLGDDKLEALRATLVVMSKVTLGELKAAQDQLKKVEGVDHESTRTMLRLARALTAAVAGEADVAERLTKDVDEGDKLSGFKMAIDAHVFAARGQQEKLRKALEKLQRNAGNGSLKRMAAHCGPASEAAGALLLELEQAAEGTNDA
jgi:hypothetical protein